MSKKRIHASVITSNNFGPRVQSREVSKAALLADLEVARPRRGRGKALAAQIIAEEAEER